MRKILLDFMWVGLAGSLGAMARLGVSRLFSWSDYPLGTLLINVTGSLFLGWFMMLIGERVIVSDTVRLAVAVGFVGAYTTFSTYMFESDKMIQDGSWWRATGYLVASLALGLIAVRMGAILGRQTSVLIHWMAR